MIFSRFDFVLLQIVLQETEIMNQGKTVFAQIMSLIPRYEFDKCVKRYNGNRHAIEFKCRDQFMVMSFAQFTDQVSLRSIADTLRMVIYEDYATGNVYRFLSNDFTHSYLTIAELYRERWQVECFFKWIKQRLHIKSFYGTSQNAVFSQIWIAICDYLLLAIAKKVYHIDQNLYILSAAIGKVLFERKPLGELFVKPKRPQNDSDDGQLTLWENFFGQ